MKPEVSKTYPRFGASLLLFVCVIFSSFGCATEKSLIPGDYHGDLAVGIQGKQLTAMFESYGGWDDTTNAPRFRCLFAIQGKAEGKIFPIISYFPGDDKSEIIRGTLEIIDDGKIKIELKDEHGGCWNVQPYFDQGGVIFDLDQKQPWIEIRMIAEEKAYFHKERTDASRSNQYAVKHGVIKISKIEDGWYYGEYQGKNGKISGWLKKSALYKLF